MGYSLSLIAVQSAEPDLALSRLGVVRAGEACEYAREPLSGQALANNWYLIVARGCDSPLLKPKLLGPLSEHHPVVACSIEEHVMFCAAEYWAGGALVWKAEHVGENGPIHLETLGVLPPGFEEMAESFKERQAAEGGEKADVDYYFEIPLVAAKSVIGFKHDEETPGVDYDHFEVLNMAPTPKGDRPWWRFWK